MDDNLDKTALTTGLRVLAWVDLIGSIITAGVMWSSSIDGTLPHREINFFAVGLGFGILFQGIFVCILSLVIASLADNLEAMSVVMASMEDNLGDIRRNFGFLEPATSSRKSTLTVAAIQPDQELEAKELERKMELLRDKIRNAQGYEEVVAYYDEIKTSYRLEDLLYEELERLQHRFNALAGELYKAKSKDEENRIEKERHEIQEKMIWLWRGKCNVRTCSGQGPI